MSAGCSLAAATPRRQPDAQESAGRTAEGGGGFVPRLPNCQQKVECCRGAFTTQKKLATGQNKAGWNQRKLVVRFFFFNTIVLIPSHVTKTQQWQASGISTEHRPIVAAAAAVQQQQHATTTTTVVAECSRCSYFCVCHSIYPRS